MIGSRRLTGVEATFDGCAAPTYVGKLLRLTLLAPDILEAVLDGRLPKGVRLDELMRLLPAEWADQRRMLLAGERG